MIHFIFLFRLQTLQRFDTSRVFVHWGAATKCIRWGRDQKINKDDLDKRCANDKGMIAGKE
jgi:hypothetical protein